MAVIANLKVLPDSKDRDLDDLRKSLKDVANDIGKLYKVSTEPVAFGLDAVKMSVVLKDDEEGGTESLESSLKDVDGVQQVNVTSTTKAMDTDFE